MVCVAVEEELKKLRREYPSAAAEVEAWLRARPEFEGQDVVAAGDVVGLPKWLQNDLLNRVERVAERGSSGRLGVFMRALNRHGRALQNK